MIAKIILLALCALPGVSHILLGRYGRGVVMLLLGMLAFTGFLVIGPNLQPSGSGGPIANVSLILLVALWGYAIYSLISLSFRGVSLEMELRQQEHFRKGMADYLKSDLDPAHEKFEEMTSVDPNDPDTQFHLAMIYKRKGMIKEAKKAFKKSLALDSEKWAWEIQQEMKDL